MYRGGIISKTPEQLEQMAAAGAIQARCLQMLAGQGPPRRHHQGARRGRREVHPLPGRGPLVQGLPRLPGLDLRLAQLDGRPRHPRALRARRRGDIISIDVGVTYEGWVADAAITVPVGEVERRGRASCSRPPGRRCSTGIAQARPGQPPRRHLPRDPDPGRARRPLGDPLAGRPRRRPRDARGPADPELRRARQGPASSRRGWCSRSSRWSTPAAPRSAWATTAGPSTPQDDSLAAHFEFTVAVTADGPRILTPWHEQPERLARDARPASAARCSASSGGSSTSNSTPSIDTRRASQSRSSSPVRYSQLPSSIGVILPQPAEKRRRTWSAGACSTTLASYRLGIDLML